MSDSVIFPCESSEGILNGLDVVVTIAAHVHGFASHSYYDFEAHGFLVDEELGVDAFYGHFFGDDGSDVMFPGFDIWGCVAGSSHGAFPRRGA